MSTPRYAKGFTLIEMTVAIVLIAILAVGSTRFIGQSAQGYINQVERQQVSTIAWIVSEQLTKSIRSALPNSVRVNTADGNNGSCLELIPIAAGTDYLTVPTLSSGSTFEAAPFSNYENSDVDADHRVAVYPSTITGLYSLTDPGTISSTIDSLGAGVTANSVALTLSSAHQFLGDSPTRRLFVVDQPELFCFSGSYLYRYRGYGYESSMPSSPSVTPDVIASDIASGTLSYSPGSLSRNGLVTISFEITGADGTRHLVTQEVHARNVP